LRFVLSGRSFLLLNQLPQTQRVAKPPTTQLSGSTNGVTTQTITGSPTVGDTASVSICDSSFSGGSRLAQYSVASGNNLNYIASQIAGQIQALASSTISASSNGATVSIRSTSPNQSLYLQNTANSGGNPTENIVQGGGPTEFISTTASPSWDFGTPTSLYTTGQTGAGAKSYVSNSAIANSTVNYVFDNLGRSVNLAINGIANSTQLNLDAIGRPNNSYGGSPIAETNNLGSFGYSWLDDLTSASKGTWMLSQIKYPINDVFSNIGWTVPGPNETISEVKNWYNTSPSATIFSQFDYQTDAALEITQWEQQQPGGRPISKHGAVLRKSSVAIPV
jgi:hypothetical protein